MKTSSLLHCAAAISIAVFTFSATSAHACACCSDPGSYSLKTGKITEYEFSQLAGIEFEKEATLFMTDAGEDGVKGVSSIADTYAITAKFDKKKWVLKLRTEDGKTGTLTLTMPAKLTDFAVDIHDGQKSGGGGPLLYKEWRFEGAATGEGIFQKGKARYSLVFQGRGNNCDNGSDFGHWQLAITGKGIDFSLHGKLVQEAAEPEKPGGKLKNEEPKADAKKDGN